MFLYKAFILTIITLLHMNGVHLIICPKKENILPCICLKELISEPHKPHYYYTTIKCDQDPGNEKLKKIIDETSGGKKVVLNKLILNYSTTQVIGNDIFGNLSFKEIYLTIGDTNSKSVNVNQIAKFFDPFKNMSDLKSIYLDFFNKLSGTDISQTLATSINSLKSIKELRIVANYEKIPNITLSDLEILALALSYTNFTTIPDFSFNTMKNLIWLQLAGGQINYIGSDSLSFEKSDKLIEIKLNINKLNSSSFHQKALVNINRPAYLDLSDNNIKYLPESVFKPFLKANDDSAINLNKNPLNCLDCRLKWLSEFKDQSKVFDAYCNGKAAESESIFKRSWSFCLDHPTIND